MIANYRRNFCIFLCFVLLMASSASAFAAVNEDEVTCKYVYVIDPETSCVVYQKNADERAYPASTTKILTCILVLENITDFSEKVTVGKEVRKFVPENSLMGLKEGENISIRDMLYGLMLLSGNDAASTLAIKVAGSEEAFADMMNAKASELGMKNSHFVNPHGLHNENHYTTAKDMALLASYALKNETFMKIVGTTKFSLKVTNKHKEPREIHNTNRFLTTKEGKRDDNWRYATGMKTGSTNAAQNCLVTSATKNGRTLISVVLYDNTSKGTARWSNSRMLLEYGFDNMQDLSLDTLGLSNLKVTLENASKNDQYNGEMEVQVKLENGAKFSALKETIDDIMANKAEIALVPRYSVALSAPINQGEQMGIAAINYKDITLGTVDLYATRTILSVEDDPKNPVTALVKTVKTAPPENNSSSTGAVIGLAILLIIIIALILLMMLNKRRLNRLSVQTRGQAPGSNLNPAQYGAPRRRR